MIQEITAQSLNPDHFIDEKVKEIKDAVGDGMAINALSGGVDSSTVTMIGHRALGNRLKTVFIENGLMREGEPEQVMRLFQNLGVTVQIGDAKKEFFEDAPETGSLAYLKFVSNWFSTRDIMIDA